MNKLINDLNSAKPGDIFITQTKNRLEYINTQGDDYSFQHLFKLIDATSKQDIFVAYNEKAIPSPAFQGYPKFSLSYKLQEAKPTTRHHYYVAINEKEQTVAIVCENNHGYDDVYGARQPEFKVVKFRCISSQDTVIFNTDETYTLDWLNRNYPSSDSEGISEEQKQRSEKEVSPYPFNWIQRQVTLEL